MKKIHWNGRTALATIAMAAGAASAYGEVVYRTDFSTRTSAKAIPSASWALSAPYQTGPLMANYTRYDGGYTPFNDSTQVQDGWAKGNDGNYTKDADFVVRADGENQFAAFVNDGELTDPSNDHNTRAVHPFYNSISTGVLRVQADMRAPSSYQEPANNNFFVGPYYRKYVNLNWGAGGVPSRPGMFGFNMHYWDTKEIKTYFYGSDGKGNFDGTYGRAVTAGHWYRFVVDFDFDAKTLCGRVYDLGTATPTFDTPDGTVWETLATKRFHTDPNPKDGPVEGFCIADAGSISGRDADEDLSKASCIDNIRFSWKASGTDFGADDVLYENDFSVRRSRTIVPGSSSTSATYVAPGGIVTNVYSLFQVNNYTYGDLTTVALTAKRVDGKVSQPYGLDGWRRMNSDGGCQFSIANPGGNGGNRLVVSGNEENMFGIVSQALGTRITSGDVKFSFDFRLPDQWHKNQRWFYAMLAGDDYLNSSTDAEQAERYVVRLGVRGDNNDNKSFICANRDFTGVHDGGAATKNHYYRGVMTVHLDANPRTVDTVLYDLGTSSVDGSYEVPDDQQPVFSRTGDTIRNRDTFKEVSCIAFYAAGVGGRLKGSLQGDGLMFIDNLKVWKKPAAETDWTAVYSNDFATRTRYLGQPKPVPLLVADTGRLGQDGWVKRNNSINPLLITAGDGENPALYADAVFVSDTTLTAKSHNTWAVQQLGTEMKNGRFTVQADLRPPRTWTEKGKIASVVLGDGLYFQCPQSGAHQFLNEYQVRFGFGENTGTPNLFGQYDKSKIYYTSSNGAEYMNAAVDPTHWYRFVAKADISKGTFDLDVYDLGKAHPTFDTATPAACVGSAKGVAFRNPLRKGEAISTLGMTAEGTRNERPWEIDDPGPMLIDNLSIDYRPAGMSVFVR